jgi:hypothetical protein
VDQAIEGRDGAGRRTGNAKADSGGDTQGKKKERGVALVWIAGCGAGGSGEAVWGGSAR